MKKLELIPGKLYEVIKTITIYTHDDRIHASEIVMLAGINSNPFLVEGKRLVFLVGKKVMMADFSDVQIKDYLRCLQ